MRRLVPLLFFCASLRAETVLALPFFNHSNSANLDWIGESIAETVGDSLASEGVLVLDRAGRLEAYRRLSLRPSAEITHASIIKIGESLDASVVVYGSYELLPAGPGDTQSKGSLRVTARLLDLQHTRQGPPFGEVGALEDLADLEVQLGWQVLEFLHPQDRSFGAGVSQSQAAGAHRRRGELRARPPGHLARTAPPLLHPGRAPGRALLAAVLPTGQDLLGEEGLQSGRRLAGARRPQRPALPGGAVLPGPVPLLQRRFHGRAKAFQTVAASVPLNEVYNNLGAAESRLNRPAEATASFQKALEGDSADPDYRFNLGYIQWRAGRFDEAVESLRAAVARNPNDAEATSLLGRALQREGPRPGDAKLEARERLKTNYDEAAYRQLQAELAK